MYTDVKVCRFLIFCMCAHTFVLLKPGLESRLVIPDSLTSSLVPIPQKQGACDSDSMHGY